MAVVAPAGPVEAAAVLAGVEVLGRRYRPVWDDAGLTRTRYLAGDDARRLAELARALTDDTVRAVFAARGGYGSLRLLDALDPILRARPPKPVVGFSDITALHLALQTAGWVSVHGPVVSQLATQPVEAVERLVRVLEDPTAPPPGLTGDGWVPGRAEGPLLGGNLSVLTRLLGTPYLPDLDGAVLLLEDVGERPYRLDRMWTHLGLAGVFRRVRGIVLGEFTDCEEPGADYSSGAVLRELAAGTGLPCLAGVAVGHGSVNLAVPLGARVRLDASAGRLDFLEPAVAAAADAAALR